MKKLLFGTVLFALLMFVSIPAMAAVDIHVSIPLPPPVVFTAPPEVIVIPETYVYVVPNVDVDLFFWNGWWWRLWQGRWYRSRYYNRAWAYYNSVPSFYFDVDPGWRRYYRDHNWYGHRWTYQRIPLQRLEKNWKSWQNDRHWERRGTWGVQNYRPRPQQQIQELRQQRQREYQQRPEVLQHQQQRAPEVRKPQGPPPIGSHGKQPPERSPQFQQPHQQHPQPPREEGKRESERPRFQGKPEERDEEHRK